MRRLMLIVVLALGAVLVAANGASACCGCGWGCGSHCGSCCWSSCGYSYCCTPCFYAGPCCCIYYSCYSPPGTLISPYGYNRAYHYEGLAVKTPAAKATVVVTLPADATLTANGQTTTTKTGRRVFVTPELESGKTYSYLLKMSVERDGQTVEEIRKVLVHAGQETAVSFETAAVATASK